MRLRANIDLLSKRREGLVVNFAKKSLNNPRTKDWFKERRAPVYARRAGVKYPRYAEETARTDRHKNSPKNYLIRKLNDCQ